MATEIIEVGDAVICDLCGADHTAPAPSAEGGITFGSRACCPECAPKIEADAKKYGEEEYIGERARPGETFRDFVFRLRGGEPARITITTWGDK